MGIHVKTPDKNTIHLQRTNDSPRLSPHLGSCLGNPCSKGCGVAGLDKDCAGAGEFADDTFACRETAYHAPAGDLSQHVFAVPSNEI